MDCLTELRVRTWKDCSINMEGSVMSTYQETIVQRKAGDLVLFDFSINMMPKMLLTVWMVGSMMARSLVCSMLGTTGLINEGVEAVVIEAVVAAGAEIETETEVIVGARVGQDQGDVGAGTGVGAEAGEIGVGVEVEADGEEVGTEGPPGTLGEATAENQKDVVDTVPDVVMTLETKEKEKLQMEEDGGVCGGMETPACLIICKKNLCIVYSSPLELEPNFINCRIT